ncbi:MAG TPA: GNAT family N-acetyltransferase [Verrucomicrobiota bacterium]|nr:GNAT family N-acetyltransferase [Verrucomicrobiota bacterium]HPU55649.1 GNAT family N-acetyltransferase [Verrucomicrobiota bacterium]
MTAWDGEELVGLGNALSDSALVVYYSHILVLPAYQRRGIGSEIMRRLMARYQGFHQHVLICNGRGLVKFYEKCGFTRANRMHSMWIYDGPTLRANLAGNGSASRPASGRPGTRVT